MERVRVRRRLSARLLRVLKRPRRGQICRSDCHVVAAATQDLHLQYDGKWRHPDRAGRSAKPNLRLAASLPCRDNGIHYEALVEASRTTIVLRCSLQRKHTGRAAEAGGNQPSGIGEEDQTEGRAFTQSFKHRRRWKRSRGGCKTAARKTAMRSTTTPRHRMAREFVEP